MFTSIPRNTNLLNPSLIKVKLKKKKINPYVQLEIVTLRECGETIFGTLQTWYNS